MMKKMSLLVVISALALSISSGYAAERKAISPPNSQPSKLFTPAIEANGFIFASGQLGFDPATGKLAEGIEAQVHMAMKSLQTVLQAGGASLDDLVKVNIYLKDMNDYNKMNEIYASYFKAAPPARTALQVGKIPLDALIEIEGIAVKK